VSVPEWLESFEHSDSLRLELPMKYACYACFGYQQQESGTYWVVRSPSAVELHSPAPLVGTSVETVVERD
jgi:hypothetical protein